MTAVRVLGSGPRRWILEAALGLASVAVVTMLLYALSADQTTAALTLVVLGALLVFVGTAAAVTGILAASASLNYFFTEPVGQFGAPRVDDVVALVALGVTTGVLGATIARVDRLRRRSDLREQEIRARLDLSNRLAAGDEPSAVIHDAETALRTIFDLAECALSYEAGGGLEVHIVEGPTPISPADRSEIAAFVMGLGTSLERVQLAEAVQDARVEAAIEQSRASFLSAMTHNLRTPLATIKAAVSGLRGTREDLNAGWAAELLESAYGESDRLERLVGKVLALSSIRAGALVAHPEPVNLAEATQGAVQRLRILADDREIVLDASADLPLVSADPALLDVVLVNVLENALRYAPRSSVEIRGRRTGSVVNVEVIDHGPGVTAIDRDRIFEEFVRIEPHAASPGTGIGLTIAKAFVDAQRGTIDIEETAGGGATVVIALPVEEGFTW
jgi:two-component system, OmpR family, sensor histidine kinase KdpD